MKLPKGINEDERESEAEGICGNQLAETAGSFVVVQYEINIASSLQWLARPLTSFPQHRMAGG